MKTLMMRAASLALCVCLALGMLASPASAADGLSNFSRSTPYTDGQFTDVPASAWYGEAKQQTVRLACELGLMKGAGAAVFAPEATMSLAEAITLAVRVRLIYMGQPEELASGSPWYQPYIDKAMELGIITTGEFTDYTRPATRAEMAYIFALSVPASQLEAIRTVDAIPDVSRSSAYSASIYALYEAGVLSGGDAYGSFAPESTITRAAAAAIVCRIALPETRQSFALETAPAAEQQPSGSYTAWADYYTSGMYIGSMDAVDELLWTAMVNMESSFTVTTSSALMDEILQDEEHMLAYAEQVDYLYYPSGKIEITVYYTLYSKLVALSLNPSVVSPKLTDAEKNYGTRAAALASSLITPDMTDYDKARALHDYMVRSYRYDEVAAANVDNWKAYAASYSLSGLLDNSTGVCQAYAELYALMLRSLGIDAKIVTGPAGGGDHAWNLVYLDGDWYHVDVTWDDPVPDGGSLVQHGYFCLSDQEMSADHSWNRDAFPAANGTKY